MISRFFSDRSAIVLRPALAVALGSADEAVIVQQIWYWCHINEEAGKGATHFINGHWWAYNSVKEWQAQFPWISEKTVQRKLKKLRDMGVLVAEQMGASRFDHRLWYRVDHEKLEELYQNAAILSDSPNMTQSEESQIGSSDSVNMSSPSYTETTTDKRGLPADIDHLNPNYRHNQTLTKTPLTNLEEIALDIAARCLKVKHDTIKAHIFKSIHGNQPNLEPFQAFCKVVDIKSFESRLTSMLDNWSTTSWGKKNNPPTLGRIIAEWQKWDGNAINEFAMIQALLKVWDNGNGQDEARAMINSEPYKEINRKMKTVDFNRGIGFKGLSKFSVDDWSKLK